MKETMKWMAPRWMAPRWKGRLRYFVLMMDHLRHGHLHFVLSYLATPQQGGDSEGRKKRRKSAPVRMIPNEDQGEPELQAKAKAKRGRIPKYDNYVGETIEPISSLRYLSRLENGIQVMELALKGLIR